MHAFLADLDNPVQPSSEGRIKTQSGKEFIRIKFRIWPGRSTTLETTFLSTVN